ncbi:MAG: deoxyribonuclease [Solirubrobacterales bacterium]|nr:deoxyribonuclease [Solirubrobacterales bacterium]
MLIGAHVSTGGGLALAIERGVERGCESIQIFNQSPRMWRPTRYGDEDFAAFREAMDASPIEAVVIHAIYLINCASPDAELRAKSLQALIHALRVGDAIGAAGVVLHPGARREQTPAQALRRAGKTIAGALGESERCPLLIEQTAGAQGMLGRDFDEIATLIDVAGGGERLGLCLDSCHLYAQGFDIGSEAGLGELLATADAKVGLGRLGCIHLNDSRDPLGSCRDRHANVREGEIGERLQVFLSEPRFEGLPATLEVPGPEKKGPDRKEVEKTKRLRRTGLKARAG